MRKTMSCLALSAGLFLTVSTAWGPASGSTKWAPPDVGTAIAGRAAMASDASTAFTNPTA